jgi:hypothetical protein
MCYKGFKKGDIITITKRTDSKNVSLYAVHLPLQRRRKGPCACFFWINDADDGVGLVDWTAGRQDGNIPQVCHIIGQKHPAMS